MLKELALASCWSVHHSANVDSGTLEKDTATLFPTPWELSAVCCDSWSTTSWELANDISEECTEVHRPYS